MTTKKKTDEYLPQTETEETIEAELSTEESPDPIQTDAVSQTDLEMANDLEVHPEDGVDASENAHSPKTETENEAARVEEAQPVRRTRKRASVENQSDAEPNESSLREAETKNITPSASRPTRRVLAIDENLAVETDADRTRNALLDLMESYKSKRILTGTIQGVELTTDDPPHALAVIYHDDFKVIIPAEQAVELPEDLRGRAQEEVLHYLLTKRLGAEIDYIVKGIDAGNGIAAASRLEAMAAKRRSYYYGADRDGNNLIYEGLCAEARVVSVIRAGIFVDLFGEEVYIPLRELSYQRMLDAQTAFQPGQRVLTKLLSIDRSDRNKIKVTASVKQVSENPYELAMRRFSIGNRYVGTVSMVDTNGVFVSLDGGVDCLCSYPKRGRPPRGARVTVRILGMNHESNRIWGAITHIAVPR